MAPIPVLAIALLAVWPASGHGFESEQARFTVRTVVEGLEHPWALAFLPEGGLLVTERPGRLRLVVGGRLDPAAIEGVPAVAADGQGGLLDVPLHPRFAENRLVYLSYAARDVAGAANTEVARARLAGGRLEDLEVVFRALPRSSGGRHGILARLGLL